MDISMEFYVFHLKAMIEVKCGGVSGSESHTPGR